MEPVLPFIFLALLTIYFMVAGGQNNNPDSWDAQP